MSNNNNSNQNQQPEDQVSGQKRRYLRRSSPVVRNAKEILHGGAIGAAQYLVGVANGTIKASGITRYRLKAAIRVLDYELGEPRKVLAIEGQGEDRILSYTQLILLAEQQAGLPALPEPDNTPDALCGGQDTPFINDQVSNYPDPQETANKGQSGPFKTVSKGEVVVDQSGHRWRVVEASNPDHIKLRSMSGLAICTMSLEDLGLCPEADQGEALPGDTLDIAGQDQDQNEPPAPVETKQDEGSPQPDRQPEGSG